MKFPNWLTFALVLPFLLLPGACRKKERVGVEYSGQSEEETAVAVTEAFGSGKILSPEEVDPEIEDLFVRIGKASREPERMDIHDMFSPETMVEALESGGMLKGFNPQQRRGFEAGFMKGFENLRNSIGQMGYHRHRIVRVEAPSEKVRVLMVQHYDTDANITFPMRWWLAKTGAGWRVFDYEDLSVGLRTVELMGALIGAGVGVNPEPWVADLMPILTRMQSINLGDPEQLATLEKPLEQLRRQQMPVSVRTFASTMMTALYQGAQRNEEARTELEAARDGGFQSPMWHYLMASCMIAEELYDDAVKELETHAGTFGWDSDSLEVLSDCHLQAGRIEEARSAALRGLEDSPGSAQCLASMVAASTPGQLRDPATAAHFSRNNDPEAAYEMALDYLIELESGDQSLALFETFRAKHPDSELIEYYLQELELEEAGKPAE